MRRGSKRKHSGKAIRSIEKKIRNKTKKKEQDAILFSLV